MQWSTLFVATSLAVWLAAPSLPLATDAAPPLSVESVVNSTPDWAFESDDVGALLGNAVARAWNVCGVGSYGSTSAGVVRASTACP